jgi:hypothetical protein
MGTSLAFQAAGRKHESLFVGQWAAPFLILGIYNKLVKLHGSDGSTGSAGQLEDTGQFETAGRFGA